MRVPDSAGKFPVLCMKIDPVVPKALPKEAPTEVDPVVLIEAQPEVADNS